jgi:hypothetical protein
MSVANGSVIAAVAVDLARSTEPESLLRRVFIIFLLVFLRLMMAANIAAAGAFASLKTIGPPRLCARWASMKPGLQRQRRCPSADTRLDDFSPAF